MQAKPIETSGPKDPIAGDPSCALDAPGLRAQGERYRELSRAVRRVDQSPDRIVVHFDDRLDRDLLKWTLGVERACCAFYVFRFHERERRLEIGVREPHQSPALDALAAAFAAGHETSQAQP